MRLVEAVAPLREFYIPRNTGNNNRHFAFAICKTPEGKQQLLRLGKIRTSKMKLLLREFDYNVYNKDDLEHENLLNGNIFKKASSTTFA